MAAYAQTTASENADAPEIDACRASGLIALKERSPTIKDVELDLDSIRVIKMNSKIGNVDIKARATREVLMAGGSRSFVTTGKSRPFADTIFR